MDTHCFVVVKYCKNKSLCDLPAKQQFARGFRQWRVQQPVFCNDVGNFIMYIKRWLSSENEIHNL
jgi:hypothetical protein